MVGVETRSFFHVSCLYFLLAKLTTAEPPPAQRKGVFPWPLLTAGGGVCLAMAVVGCVSQRIRVFSTRWPGELGTDLTSTEESGVISVEMTGSHGIRFPPSVV